jgi:carbon starvation protein
MLMEGLVGITALVACSALYPGDYFAINVAPAKFGSLGMTTTNLATLSQEVGENVAGRTGGAVSLALGMAQVFTALPGMRTFMSYWYHFAILFEALFILTTIDAGTRVGRFVLQELLGKVYRPFERTDSIPNAVIASVLIVGAWVYFILTGSVSTIWPMFGIANQLLAVVALAIATSVIINSGRAQYAWVTLLPMAFVATTTMTAGFLSIRDVFLPMAHADKLPGDAFKGMLNSVLTGIMMSCVIMILLDAVPRWLRNRTTPVRVSAAAEAA